MEFVKRNEGENMQIRRMKLEDYKEVDRLMAQVHKIHVEGRPDLYVDVEHIYSMETFKKMVEDPDTISIAAEVDGTIAGICFVSMRYRTCMVKRKTAYMDDLCVDKAYRGRGIGRQLFEYAKEQSRKMGAERLDLMVWEFNESAFAFYQKMGMKIQRYIMEEQL